MRPGLPDGALLPATMVDEHNAAKPKHDREVDSVCPLLRVGCQLTYQIANDKIGPLSKVAGGPANERRLCVRDASASTSISRCRSLDGSMIRRTACRSAPMTRAGAHSPDRRDL